MLQKYKHLFFIWVLLIPALSAAQQRVLIVFPEDDKIVIPYTFLKNDLRGTPDSVAMKFLTLKYLFYNELTQQLANGNFKPFGSVNSNVNQLRKYEHRKWFSSDSATQAALPKKKYLAALVDETNRSFYNMYSNSDTIDYILFINKVDVGANFFRKWFATKNYLLQVHFDVYDKNLKHLGGRYLRKKVRLTRDTFWSAFQTHFAAIPNELALHFINMKK